MTQNDKILLNRVLIALLFLMILLNMHLALNNTESIESCEGRLYEHLTGQKAPAVGVL